MRQNWRQNRQLKKANNIFKLKLLVKVKIVCTGGAFEKHCPEGNFTEGKLSGGNYPGILNGGNCPKPVYDNFIGLVYFWVLMAMAL